MSGYKYDEEGGQFMTFCLTTLLAFMVPYTYRVLRPQRKTGTPLSTHTQRRPRAG